MSGWSTEERQMIRDGMSWGDVWMLRRPHLILEQAEKMIAKSQQREKKKEEEEKEEAKKDEKLR